MKSWFSLKFHSRKTCRIVITFCKSSMTLQVLCPNGWEHSSDTATCLISYLTRVINHMIDKRYNFLMIFRRLIMSICRKTTMRTSREHSSWPQRSSRSISFSSKSGIKWLNKQSLAKDSYKYSITRGLVSTPHTNCNNNKRSRVVSRTPTSSIL